MEIFSSPCRSVPKALRKTKLLEAKGRRVFGAPLLLSVQQTGEPLPPSILRALVYLRTECLDQVRSQCIKCTKRVFVSPLDGTSLHAISCSLSGGSFP